MLTGYPAMPIYWALGYHLCRWGYNSSDSTWETVKSMRNYGIPQVETVYFVRLSVWLVEFLHEVNNVCWFDPQDVQWNDIDYMEHFLDFTFDSAKFATLPDLVKDLHAHDQRYVMILVLRRLYLLSYICVCVSVVSDVARSCDGCVSTCRIQVSAAHSPRAHTGRSMKG